ncbi:MAG TPA: hypothetical protein VNJ02_20090 [Vicinamibacterales bacterium]|nr:hypothetical protein [Vicinamibacterales bacterium]
MDWKSQLGDVLQRYGNANPNTAPGTVDDDFDHFSRSAPPGAMADGLAAAFRSDQTPPFANMLAQMFGRSSPTQRASMLNSLIATLGPALMAQIASRSGRNLPTTPGQQVTPEVAQQISPEFVEQMAKQAEQQDPSIIDRMSDFYAQQPALVKTLGGLALTLAMARMAQRQFPGGR